MEPNENHLKYRKLAEDVLRLSRNTLLVNLRFLDMALSRFEFVELTPEIPAAGLAVDGRHIFFDPAVVLRRYREEKNAITRDYLHMVFHCIFHHAFVDTLLDTDAWDLACDIAVENAINGLNLSCVRCAREVQQSAFMEKIRSEVKFLTAEKIYHYLREKGFTATELTILHQTFYSDDHSIWYAPLVPAGTASPDEQTKRLKRTGQPVTGSGNENTDAAGDSGEAASKAAVSRSQLKSEWDEIARRMQTDMETFSKKQGDSAGDLTQNLRAVTREKYDYESFLKSFSVLGEAMKINDDEFDYIFYTYGLRLYEKMPLIEPLEYKEVRRIREFVIAIDTSGSVSGELVQKFIQKTYNILKQQESFFTKINLHIIQCDAEVHEDFKITNQDEFDDYLKRMTLKGFGGTDFRPVFSHVEELRRSGEFVNLKGLIYFTDGYGTFPKRQPDYNTAFVFIDDEYNNPDVPVWAIKLVLPSEDI